MKKFLKTAGVVLLIYLIAVGATFLMSARMENLDTKGVNCNTAVSLR